MGPIASLFARIGVKADTQAVDKFDLQLKSVLNTAKIAAVGVSAFAVGIAKVASDSFKTASALKQFEVETGASTTQLQKWQAVAQQAGSSAESVAAGVRAIVQNQQAIKLGKGNYSPFLMLGIDPMQDPFKVLQDFRDKATGLAPAMQANMAKSMGLSADMLRVLTLSNSEFAKMADGAFYMSPAQINSIDKARESVAGIQNAFGHLKNQITAAIAPEIAKLAKQFIAFVKNNKGFVDGIRNGVQWVMKLAQAVGHVVMTISNVITKTMGWQGALMAIAGVFAIINAPVMLLAGGLLMLFLIIDDIIAYTEGRDSLLGRFFDSAPELKKGFDDMLGFVREFMELLGAAFSGDWDNYDQIIDKWGAFGVLVKGIGETLQAFKNILWGLFTGDYSDFDKQMNEWGRFGDIIRGIGSQLSLVASLVKAVFSGDWSNFDQTWQNTFRQTNKMLGYSDSEIDEKMGIDPASQQELQNRANLEDFLTIFGPQTGDYGVDVMRMMPQLLNMASGNATTNNVNITVEGSADPQATGEAVNKSIRHYLERRPAQK